MITTYNSSIISHPEAFNKDSVVQQEVVKIINFFKINHYIETGSNYGETSDFISNYVEKIDGIEINKEYYDVSVKRRINKSNINFHLGNSLNIIPQLKINSLPLCYLDAHWYDDWPLLKEIELIGQITNGNAILIIDDIKVPNRNLKFDSYKNIENSIDFIKPTLDLYFKEYLYYYNDKSIHKFEEEFMRGCYGVGKIYIFPKELINLHIENFAKKENEIYYSIL